MVEPGVTVQFDDTWARGLTVYGRLLALGTAQQPIVFTRMPAGTRQWTGITFYGYSDAPSLGSKLDHVTVEYGGAGMANIYAVWGQVAISNSTIRGSQKDGVYVAAGGDLVSIQGSQIVNSGQAGVNYGVYNNDALHTVVSAADNWWGDPAGPTVSGQCPKNTQGSKVSDGVLYKPFLTGAPASAGAGPLTPTEPFLLTLEPLRPYVVADLAVPATIRATLRDGYGLPAAGHHLYANTTLGSIAAGEVTDVQGQTYLQLTSGQAGDATVDAWTDQPGDPCLLMHHASTTITFQAPSQYAGGPLVDGQEAPYISGNLSAGPEPVTRLVPLTVQATLHNPYTYPLLVNGILGVTQSGLGLAFPPIGEWHGQTLAPGGTLTLSAPYLPTVEGHFCFKFGYSWSVAPAAPAAAPASVQDCGWSPSCNWSAFLGLNVDAAPASSFNAQMRAAFKKEGQKKLNLTDFGSTPPPPNQNDAGTSFNLDWRRRLDYTRDLNEGMSKDPPRQDYNVLATPQRPPLKTYSTLDGLTADQAAKVNVFLDALTDAIALGRAILISDDRYAGAVAAGDLTWMNVQSTAVLYYRQKLGVAYVRVADAVDAWLVAYPGDTAPTFADVVALQTRLQAGFTQADIDRYQALGLSPAEIEAMRLAFVNANPADKVITMRQELADVSASYRSLGNLLANPPPTFSQQAGAPVRPAATPAAVVGNLAAIYDVERTMEVGNPLATTATIDLKVRRLGMPADWAVAVSPSTLTLGPGQQQTVKVRISPAPVAVQGTTPAIAVEGFANGQLISGVEFKVAVPSYTRFGFRLYLPMLRR